MTKKNLVVMAVFVAGMLGGATAAVASARSQSDKAPCAIDMCRDINGRCVICPEL